MNEKSKQYKMRDYVKNPLHFYDENPTALKLFLDTLKHAENAEIATHGKGSAKHMAWKTAHAYVKVISSAVYEYLCCSNEAVLSYISDVNAETRKTLDMQPFIEMYFLGEVAKLGSDDSTRLDTCKIMLGKLSCDFDNVMTVDTKLRQATFKARKIAMDHGCEIYCRDNPEGRKMIAEAVLNSIKDVETRQHVKDELAKKSEPFFRKLIELAVSKTVPPGQLGDADIGIVEPLTLVRNAVETCVLDESSRNISTNMRTLELAIEGKVLEIKNNKERKGQLKELLTNIFTETKKTIQGQRAKLASAHDALTTLSVYFEDGDAKLPSKWELRRKAIKLSGSDVFGTDSSVIGFDHKRNILIRGAALWCSNMHALEGFMAKCILQKLITKSPKSQREHHAKLRAAQRKITTHTNNVVQLNDTITDLKKQLRYLSKKNNDYTKGGGSGKKKAEKKHVQFDMSRISSTPSSADYACYNCGSTDHRLGDCKTVFDPDRIADAKAAAEAKRNLRKNQKSRLRQAANKKRKRTEKAAASADDDDYESDDGARNKRSTKRLKIMTPSLSRSVVDAVANSLKHKINRVRARRSVRAATKAKNNAAEMMHAFVDAVADKLVSEGMAEAVAEKAMSDWMTGAIIAMVHPTSNKLHQPTVNLLKSTTKHPIICPTGLQEPGWMAEVTWLDGPSVGAIASMCADTGAQFCCITSEMGAKMVAAGFKMFKASDGIIAQVSTDVEVEGIVYGDLVLHSPTQGIITFKRMQCVVLPGDEVLLSNWCLDQLGLDTYGVLNAAADKAVVIDGNVQDQNLIADVEAANAYIRRVHGTDTESNVIHYFDPRSVRDEPSFSEEGDNKVRYSSVKHNVELRSNKMPNIVSTSDSHTSSNFPDRSNALGARTKGTRLTRIRMARKRDRSIRQLNDFKDSMNSEDISEIQYDIDNIMLSSFYTFVDSLHIPMRDKQRHKDRMQDVVYANENIFRVKALMEDGADIDPYIPSMKPGHVPVVCKRPNFSAQQIEAADKMVNKMVAAGYWSITHNSIYASPLMMVPKPSSVDNPWRPTVNMQRINSKISPAVWPFPRLRHSFRHITKSKSKFFGTADLDGAFQQISIHKDYRHIFSVMTDKGVYEPSRILQGSVDSPAYFQGQVAEKLGAMLGPKLLQWLDDLVNHSSTLEGLIDNWEELFAICKRYNFKLSVKKMVLGGEQVKYCGYIIDGDGYQYEPSSYQSLLEMKTPRDAQELSQLVNCTNWMRSAICRYADLVKPLRVVLENVYKAKGNRTKYGLKRYRLAKFGWNADCDEAYRLIKESIVHRMKLYFPDADGTDQLCVVTDASETGWCGVVTAVENWKDGVEVQDQIHKPVGFTSGIFTGSELNWNVQSKEAFSLWQTVTKMQHVTRSMPFKAFTDNKNVSHLFQRGRLWPHADLPKVTAKRLLGWAEEMANFDYTLEHIDGTVMEKHLWADMVSRWANPSQHRVAGELAAVKAIRWKARAVRFDSFLNYGYQTKIDAFEWPSPKSIKASQKKFRSGTKIDLHRVRSDGLLSPVGKTTIWIPSKDKQLQVSLCVIAHCSLSGHRGLETTTQNLEDYFWVTMKEDLKTFTSKCLQCEQVKGKRTVPRPYGNVVKGTKRNECITFDYLHVEKPAESSPHQHKYILVIKDTYSHFTLLYPCEAADSHTAATALSHWVGIFGVPRILLSDRGSHFKNSTIEEFARLIGVDKHHFTLPHTPWSNGSVERVNLEILNLLAMLIGEQGVLTWEWPYYINGIVDVLNSTPSRTLAGLSPREVMLDLPRTNLAKLLVKVPEITAVKSVDLTGADIEEQVQITSDALSEMHYRVDLAAEKRRTKNRKHRVKKWKAVRGNFDIGCFVMHARVKTTSDSKLSFHWHGPYRVTGLHSDQVIDIEHLVTGKQRSVHTTRVKYYSGPDMEIPEVLLESITYQDSVRYKVQHILAVRLNPVSTTYEFFVKWKGFAEAENSWEPMSTLQIDVPTLLVEFVKTMKPSNHKSILTDAVAA